MNVASWWIDRGQDDREGRRSRNCLQRDVMRETGFQYYPMARPAVENALRLKSRV